MLSSILLVFVFCLYYRRAINDVGVFNIYFIALAAGSYYLIVSPYYIELNNIELFGYRDLDYDYLRYFGASYYLSFYFALRNGGSTKGPPLFLKINYVYALMFLLGIVIFLFGVVGDGVFQFESANFVNISLPLFLFLGLTAFANSGKKSHRLFHIVIGVFVSLLSGFRIRLLLFLMPLLGLSRSINYIRLFFIIILLPPIFSIIEVVRIYGQGIDLDRFAYLSLSDFSLLPVGELGPPVISAVILSKSSLTGTIYFNPFVEGITRMLPSLLTGEKEVPQLQFFINRILLPSEYEYSGLAPLVLGELYYQFGMLGGLIGGFIHGYFFKKIHDSFFSRFHNDLKVVLVGYLSFFFGYYIFSRGYFFQTFSEIMLVLLVLKICSKKLPRS